MQRLIESKGYRTGKASEKLLGSNLPVSPQDIRRTPAPKKPESKGDSAATKGLTVPKGMSIVPQSQLKPEYQKTILTKGGGVVRQPDPLVLAPSTQVKAAQAKTKAQAAKNSKKK